MSSLHPADGPRQRRLRQRWLRQIVTTSVRRPWMVLAITAAISVGALVPAFKGLGIHTSNLDLVDAQLPTVSRFLSFADDFGNPNMLVALAESDDPELLAATVDQLAADLRRLPEVRSVFDRLPYSQDTLDILKINPYLRSDDGELYALFVQPRDVSSSADAMEPFVESVRRVLSSLPQELSSVRMGITGIPVYALDDRDVIQRDIAKLSGIGAALILLLFISAFANGRRPLLALLTLTVAVGITLGIASIFPGHLTLLSAFFGSILFGLGIDFAIHLIDRMEALIADGIDIAKALPRAAAELDAPLTTAAVTSASAFFAMMLSGFRGFEQLGWIAGIGLLLAFLVTVTVLPALLMLFGRGQKTRARESRIGILLASMQKPVLTWLILGGGLALGIAALITGRPNFDSDYLALQPEHSETVRWERELVSRSPWSTQFAAFTVDSREQLMELTWTLINDETVGAVRSLRDFELPGLPGALPALPDAILSTLRTEDGRLAVYAYPTGDIWHAEIQDAFLGHMRAIDPEVTGMPFLGRLMVDQSRRALFVTGMIGLALLTLWVLWDFRQPSWALLAMMPAIGTLITTAGVMALLGIDFHPLNVMALPVILGIAVDDGIHIVHRFRASLHHETLSPTARLRQVLNGTGRSVVLTSLTNLAAFGCLILTDHQGLASFAQLLCLGVSLALVLSTLVLPQLLLRLARSFEIRPSLGYWADSCKNAK